MESSLKQGLQVQLLHISKQGRAAAFLVAEFSCLTHPCLTPPPTPAFWERQSCAPPEEAGKGGRLIIRLSRFLIVRPSRISLEQQSLLSSLSPKYLGKAWDMEAKLWACMETHQVMPSALKDLSGWVWQFQNHGYSRQSKPGKVLSILSVSPGRLSSLWQSQCVMFPGALKESSMHMQMASTFNLMKILENVYPSDRQLKIKL